MLAGDDRDCLGRLRDMQREAAEPGGLRRLLTRFADEVDGSAALFDSDWSAPLLERSLLNSPSLSYDLRFAFRALD